jgi:membrane-associated protease RseP (regulator of RpoE activity)
MKFLDNYLKKRIKELDEHPELNKNRKITQAQTEKIVKFILFIIMICFFIFLCHFRVSYTLNYPRCHHTEDWNGN